MTTEQSSAAITDLTGDYDVDPAHSRLGFVARHAMVTKVRGQFRTFSGKAHLDEAAPESSTATVEIDMASIDTGQEQRDGHLRANDFFDVPNHPKATFTSTSVAKTGDGTYRMTGDLTLKGVTKPVSIDWEFTGTGEGPVRKPARGLRRDRHDQPQGLGRRVERSAGDRRRARLRPHHAGVRGVRREDRRSRRGGVARRRRTVTAAAPARRASPPGRPATRPRPRRDPTRRRRATRRR